MIPPYPHCLYYWACTVDGDYNFPRKRRIRADGTWEEYCDPERGGCGHVYAWEKPTPDYYQHRDIVPPEVHSVHE